MIINIRGTSGSGKSSLVRKLLLNPVYTGRTRCYEKDRKQPIGYVYHRSDNRPNLAVIGHYETDCGGCDTISKMEHIFDLVKKSASAGMDVVFEGLLISADVKRTTELWQWLQEREAPFAAKPGMLVVALDVPLEVCLASVNERRQRAFQRRVESIHAQNLVLMEQGRKLLELPEPKGDVNPRNTESKHKGVELSLRRLGEAGVPCAKLDRDAALARIQQELGA